MPFIKYSKFQYLFFNCMMKTFRTLFRILSKTRQFLLSQAVTIEEITIIPQRRRGKVTTFDCRTKIHLTMKEATHQLHSTEGVMLTSSASHKEDKSIRTSIRCQEGSTREDTILRLALAGMVPLARTAQLLYRQISCLLTPGVPMAAPETGWPTSLALNTTALCRVFRGVTMLIMK